MNINGVKECAAQETAGVKRKEHLIFIDALRVLCCFYVIVNHTITDVFLRMSPAKTWYAALMWFYMSKVAVPVFLMITGYTMLGRQDSYRKTLVRFARFAAGVVLFSVPYYVSDSLGGAIEAPSLAGFLVRVYQGPITNAMWYMYLYLGIVLMTPFIQKLASTFERRDFHVYFLVSGFFFAFWPILVHYNESLSYSEYFILPIFNSYLCILLMGYYLRKYNAASVRLRIAAPVVYLAACVLMVALTYTEYYRMGGMAYVFIENKVYFPVLLCSVCVFYFFLNARFPACAKKGLAYMGSLTFGIYLVADFMIEKLEFVYLVLTQAGVHQLIAMLAFEVLVFAASAAVVAFLKKIPGIRSLI